MDRIGMRMIRKSCAARLREWGRHAVSKFRRAPRDDMILESEAADLVSEGQPLPLRAQPARRGRKPKILMYSRGKIHTCTTTARKILPRPFPIQVPITLSHLRPPPPPLPLPPPARSKPPQSPLMVRSALQPPNPTNSGRKILPWPHLLTPASLAPTPQQQKLQPLNPSLTTCPPFAGAQTLPVTRLQPISSGVNSGLMPLQPLSLAHLRPPPPSGCISQLRVPLSPQKVTAPPKASRKTPISLPQLAAGPPTPCTRVPLLPLKESTVKRSSPSQAMQTTTAGHVRKLLPRPLKATMMPATNTVFHQQQQQQGAMATLQHLHPATPVSTQQTISLQQLQNLNPPTTQTTNLALQTLNVGGQQPSLSRSSQVVSLQHVQALAVSQSSQKAQPPEQSLQPPHHLPTAVSSTSPQRVTFQQVQQGPSVSVSQAVAIHPLPLLAPSTQQQKVSSLCQIHTLQSAAGHTQRSSGTSLQALTTIASDSQNTVPVHQYSSHAPGNRQAVPQVSPGDRKSPLSQMSSAPFCNPQSAAPSQAELQNSEHHTTLHGLSQVNHTFKEGSIPLPLCPDTSHPAQGQDVLSLRITPRQGIATMGSGIPVRASPNGTVLKVPIQPLRSSVSYSKVKRKYLRRSPRVLKSSKKKDISTMKLSSVTTSSWPLNVQEKDLYTSTSTAIIQGRKILPRPCFASLVGSQLEHLQPVTTNSSSGWLVQKVRQHAGCGTAVTSHGSSVVATLPDTVTSLCESQLPTCGLPQSAKVLSHSSANCLATTDQGDTGNTHMGENFLQPVSPAKAVAACTFVKNIIPTPEGAAVAMHKSLEFQETV
ncbi:hypothetical protein GWK47_025977 [Chionoecetes opilio]|uniref:Uncharacterized protein n=1 Tax=Chionoecetes opilio TaxID=41210 RepID=A0A8J8WFC3_CHIOP|nr:hypothetical protein GWK47_025977 [Chionoecetes opilio]